MKGVAAFQTSRRRRVRAVGWQRQSRVLGTRQGRCVHVRRSHFRVNSVSILHTLLFVFVSSRQSRECRRGDQSANYQLLPRNEWTFSHMLLYHERYLI